MIKYFLEMIRLNLKLHIHTHLSPQKNKTESAYRQNASGLILNRFLFI